MGQLSFGSLFSGIGGFDLGLEQAGFECSWQVETDHNCQVVLQHHWPHLKVHHDVRKFRDATPVDLLCGGFPCQDLSVAGKRRGLDGKRSGLWFEFRRVVHDLRPKWVLIENVPGLLSSNNGSDMGIVLRGLAELGYWWAYRTLDSQYFGVAQRRRRIFIIGHLGGQGAAKVLFDGASLQGDPPQSQQAGEEIAGPLGRVASESGGHRLDLDTNGAYPLTLAETQAFNIFPKRGQGADLEASVTEKAMALDGTALSASTDRGTRVLSFAENQRGELRFMEVSAQLSTGGGKPGSGYSAALDGKRPRRLTPLECERLQGFPDNWTLIGDMTDTSRYRMLGNAVTVPVARWIGGRILKHET